MRGQMRSICLVLILSLILIGGATVQAAVKVSTGPTPIPNGDARGKDDLTLQNDKLAVTFAVTTAPPWGVARGGIVDGAVVRNGKIEADRIALVDFIPNNWSAWPTTYQRVTIEKNTPEEVVIKTERDWEKTKLTSFWSLKNGEDKLHLTTTMLNESDKPLENLLSGYVLWTNGGYLFSPPGLDGPKKAEAKGALAAFATAYDSDWIVALHAPYFNYINYYGRDMYLQLTLKPGESKSFEGWMQILPSGDVSHVLSAETAREKKQTGKLSGQIKAAGQALDNPVVVVEKNGVAYTWAMGQKGTYQLELPVGEYIVYASARNYASSSKAKVTIAAGQTVAQNFDDLKAPGQIAFQVTSKKDSKPVDARIVVTEGQKQTAKFLGQQTFFTEIGQPGRLEMPIAPGKYVFEINAGAPFFSKTVKAEADVVSGAKKPVEVAVDVLFEPQKEGWFNSDLHHHSNLMDGATPPEFLVRSQLAANLDFTFISDHDLALNHKKIKELSDQRQKLFIPGIEVSPSWGHFNIYPVKLGEPMKIDVGVATIDDIIAEAKRLEAQVIGVNHPFNDYGYFKNLDKAPGGWNPRFHFIELNSMEKYDKPIAKVYDFWNAGHRYYLTAGTDTHDVWTDTSGKIRMFVNLTGEPNIANFIMGLKTGRSYATTGPLIYPEIMFGKELKVKKDEELKFNFKLAAALGLKEATLIGKGQPVKTVNFTADQTTGEASFTVKAGEKCWFSLIVIDAKDNKAWSNPVWVDVVEYPKSAK